jgi:hypothetical protein
MSMVPNLKRLCLCGDFNSPRSTLNNIPGTGESLTVHRPLNKDTCFKQDLPAKHAKNDGLLEGILPTTCPEAKRVPLQLDYSTQADRHMQVGPTAAGKARVSMLRERLLGFEQSPECRISASTWRAL